MKPYFEDVESKRKMNANFHVYDVTRIKRPKLSDAWHYHPEIEICLTLKSRGKRFVGNTATVYEIGDLAMFGVNLPHGYTTNENTKQIVIQFKYNFLGNHFFHYSEFKNVYNLIYNSRAGIEFIGKGRKRATKKILKLLGQKNGLLMLSNLLDILNLLSKTKDYKKICSDEFANFYDVKHIERTSNIYSYIMDHFQEDISIKDISKHVYMTESAFYKYIKRHTQKTFIQLLNEFRINHATKLLLDEKYSIAEIGFYSGFKNASYFNKKFKEAMSVSPLEYKTNAENNNI